jgi:hypothetical protein
VRSTSISEISSTATTTEYPHTNENSINSLTESSGVGSKETTTTKERLVNEEVVVSIAEKDGNNKAEDTTARNSPVIEITAIPMVVEKEDKPDEDNTNIQFTKDDNKLPTYGDEELIDYEISDTDGEKKIPVKNVIGVDPINTINEKLNSASEAVLRPGETETTTRAPTIEEIRIAKKRELNRK